MPAARGQCRGLEGVAALAAAAATADSSTPTAADRLRPQRIEKTDRDRREIDRERDLRLLTKI